MTCQTISGQIAVKVHGNYFVICAADAAALPSPTMPKNVLGTDLVLCSKNPLTGFYRDGCCRTGAEDQGLHLICCQVNEDFLRHQYEIGNDLITPRPQWLFPGLKPGDRWCVCITRWKQSLDEGKACPVHLEATHISALEFVTLDELRRYQVPAKAEGQ